MRLQEYAGKSHEELRLESYTQHSQVGPGAVPVTPESFGSRLLQPTIGRVTTTTGAAFGGGIEQQSPEALDTERTLHEQDTFIAATIAADFVASSAMSSAPAAAADASYGFATRLSAVLNGGPGGMAGTEDPAGHAARGNEGEQPAQPQRMGDRLEPGGN